VPAARPRQGDPRSPPHVRLRDPAVVVPVVPVARPRQGDPRKGKDPRLTLGLRGAPVLSRRHPGQDPFTGRNPEAAAGDVRPIHDPGHFAISSDLFL
jgi:hypothetical protein